MEQLQEVNPAAPQNNDLARRVEKINFLARLLSEQLKKETNLKKKEIIQLLIKLLTASATAIGATLLYINPTKDFAGDNIAALIILELCAVLSNFGLTTWAAYLTMDEFKSIDENELRKISNDDLDVKTKRALNIIKKTIVSIVSLVSAVPYAFAAQDEAIITKAIIGLSNAFTNFVAVNNFLIPDLQWFASILLATKATRAYQEMHNAFAYNIREISYRIIKEGKVPAEFLPGSNLEGNELLEFIAQKIVEYKIPIYQSMTTKEIFYHILAGILGALGMGSLMIYLLKMDRQVVANFSVAQPLEYTLDTIFSGPFAYVVLRIGAQTGVNIMNTLLGKGQSSLAYQLAPRITLFLSFLIAAITAGSFATIVDFILKDPNFNGGAFTEFRTIAAILGGVSAWGFNNYGNLKLLEMGMKFGLSKLGDKSSRELINFGTKIENFLEIVRKDMSREVFASSIEKLYETNPQDAHLLVPLTTVNKNLADFIQDAKGQKKPAETKGILSQFFARTPKADSREKQRLLPTSQVNAKGHYGGVEKEPNLIDDQGCFKRLLTCCPNILPRFHFGRMKSPDAQLIVDPNEVVAQQL